MIEDVTGHAPFAVLQDWFAAARGHEINDPNAATLATADASGRPRARIVLVKEWDDAGLVVYTNTTSRKGRDLAENPQASLCFHWKSLQRQVRLEGPVSFVSDAQADAYFQGRPRTSRIGAWASDQSAPLDGRATFEARLAELQEYYAEGEVPRPPHWTGYRLQPDAVEFWVERPYRLHDRWVFKRAQAGPTGLNDPEGWTLTRLYP